jgi:hypothetical protein
MWGGRLKPPGGTSLSWFAAGTLVRFSLKISLWHFALRQLLALFILTKLSYGKLTILALKSCAWCREYKFVSVRNKLQKKTPPNRLLCQQRHTWFRSSPQDKTWLVSFTSWSLEVWIRKFFFLLTCKLCEYHRVSETTYRISKSFVFPPFLHLTCFRVRFLSKSLKSYVCNVMCHVCGYSYFIGRAHLLNEEHCRHVYIYLLTHMCTYYCPMKKCPQ